MVCIYCGHATSVINSRLQKRANQVWRRRKCTLCNAIFTTHEAPDLSTALMVQHPKKDLEPFSRDTLFISLYEALKHRPAAIQEADALTATIISELMLIAAHGMVTRHDVLGATTIVLERLDQAAATVYRAYHTTEDLP